MVAPHTGAWIETISNAFNGITSVSHPTRVRGLKRDKAHYGNLVRWSHPTRVRGLKL